MNSKVCIGFVFSHNQCLPIIFLQFILHGNREQGHVFTCAGQYFILGSSFTVYDTVLLNYGSLGIVCGLNIVERGDQMEMWVRDKGRHSLLMKKRVSDSLWLAEGILCAHRPGSSLCRKGGGGGNVEVAEPQEVSDYATA